MRTMSDSFIYFDLIHFSNNTYPLPKFTWFPKLSVKATNKKNIIDFDHKKLFTIFLKRLGKPLLQIHSDYLKI